MAEETTEEKTAEDFGEAFGEDEGTPPIEESEEGATKEEPTPAETEEESPKEPEEEPDEPGSEEEPAKPEEDKEKPATDDAAADDKPTYEELEQQYKSLQGMYNFEVKKKKEPPKEEPEPEEEPEADFATEVSGIVEKISNLESVKNADDEVGEGLSKALADVTGLIAKEILSTMEQRQAQRFGDFSKEVQPLHEHYVNAETREKLNTIETTHPDFMKYVKSGELKLWVESHEGLKKSLYSEVYENGGTSDIVDMVAEFRASKGYNEAPKEEHEKEVDTSRLEDMEAVPVKKGPVIAKKAGADQSDFGAAFEED